MVHPSHYDGYVRKGKKMKKTAFATAIIAALLAFSGLSYAYQGGWYGCCGMMGQNGPTGPGGWYCPWMGGYNGYRSGPNGPSSYSQSGQPLTKDQAEQLVINSFHGNPNLKLGAFVDKGDFYDATIVTKKEGALVARIQVDKKTGWFRNVQ